MEIQTLMVKQQAFNLQNTDRYRSISFGGIMTHEVLVVKIESVSKHPNADNLEIISISGYTYSIISKKGDFLPGDLGIFIEPDYVVKTTRNEFSSIHDGKHDTQRITVRRFRGLWSEGLLIKAKDHHKLGDNVMEELEITRWEPPLSKGFRFGAEGTDLKSGIVANSPKISKIPIPEYHLENFKKYFRLVSENDIVYYTTKIHGTSARFVFWNGEMHCGSRTTWKRKPGLPIEYYNHKTGEIIQKQAPENSWWEALKQNPWIEEWCKNNPGMIVYGEVFGSIVQGNKFHYGYKDGKLGFRVFDVFRDDKWVDFDELVKNPIFNGLKLVPILFHGKHDAVILEKLAEAPEDSLENCGKDHIREGIVIKNAIEKFNEKIGRIALKFVSKNYLMKS